MRKHKDIDIELLEQRTRQHKRIKDIAEEFGVSIATIKRRKQEHNIRSYSNISQHDLEDQIIDMKNKATMSNWGMRMTQGYLSAKGIEVGEGRVLNALRNVDSTGIQQRKQRTVKRRQYINEISNSV